MQSNTSAKVGIIGGGQLARMMIEAAHKLGITVAVLENDLNAPAMQIADEKVLGDFKDHDAVKTFAEKHDVLTFDIESVNEKALIELVAEGKVVHPRPSTLARIKDKLVQKQLLTEAGIVVPPFIEVNTIEDAKSAGEQLGFPYVLKTRSGGYDGRGNFTVNSEAEVETAFTTLGGRFLYAEGFVNFSKELAIVAARNEAGEMKVFPLVETVHKDHICDTVTMPAPVSDVARNNAEMIAKKVLALFEGAGVFAIELFLAGDTVLVNEIAPRVHNSGHLTIEACETSQFEQHIRAITGMPLGETTPIVKAAVMKNILGARSGATDPKGVEAAEAIQGVKVHLYGKEEVRVKRKMGHITAVAETAETAKENAEKAHSLISL